MEPFPSPSAGPAHSRAMNHRSARDSVKTGQPASHRAATSAAARKSVFRASSNQVPAARAAPMAQLSHRRPSGALRSECRECERTRAGRAPPDHPGGDPPGGGLANTARRALTSAATAARPSTTRDKRSTRANEARQTARATTTSIIPPPMAPEVGPWSFRGPHGCPPFGQAMRSTFTILDPFGEAVLRKPAGHGRGGTGRPFRAPVPIGKGQEHATRRGRDHQAVAVAM